MAASVLARAVVVLTLVFPAAAIAEPVRRVPALPESVAATRIVLHYTTTGTDAITATDAARLAGLADEAIGVGLEGAGFPAPTPDADGRIDVYVHLPEEHLASGAEASGVARLDQPITLGSGYILVGTAAARVSDAAARALLIHEFNHLGQFASTPLARVGLGWLREATANWAANAVGRTQRTTPTPALTPYFADTGLPLDCEFLDPCNATNLDQGGYDRWIVLAQFEQIYGAGFVRAWWGEIAKLAALPADGEITALSTLLAAHGATLGQAFTALARVNLAGLDLPRTQGVRPRPRSELALTSGQTATTQRTVDHLAIDNVALKTQSCKTGRLHLEVDAPAAAGGTSPVFWQDGAAPVVLSGGRADIAWRPACGTAAMLSLPNGSPSGDDLAFTVRAKLTLITPKVTRLRVRGHVATFTLNAPAEVLIFAERRQRPALTPGGLASDQHPQSRRQPGVAHQAAQTPRPLPHHRDAAQRRARARPGERLGGVTAIRR